MAGHPCAHRSPSPRWLVRAPTPGLGRRDRRSNRPPRTPLARRPKIRIERPVRLRLSGIFRDESNRFLVLGGDNGLRGYPVGFLAGDRRAVFQGELRTRSIRLFLGSRWGALAFYDVGGADDINADVSMFHNVGIGIRALGPQLSPEVFRFDLAFPLTPYTAGGAEHGVWPPRFIAGYRQAF